MTTVTRIPGAIPEPVPPRISADPVPVPAQPPVVRAEAPRPSLVPPPNPALAAALRPPVCSPSRQVSLRIHQDDGSQPATVATLPGNAFYCSNDAPGGLEGPRVRIRVDGDIKTAESNIPGLAQLPLIGYLTTNVITEPSTVPPATADSRGNFDRAEIDTAQTTSFFAANQTITLAERAARRNILWGDDGQLTVRPNAFVGSSSLELNAFFLGGAREVQLGSLGNVRNGRPVPLEGTSVAYLEHALSERERVIAASETALRARGESGEGPASVRELRLQTAALRTILAAAGRDDVPEVQRLIAAERDRERVTDPGSGSPGGLAGLLSAFSQSPTPGNREPLPSDAFMTLGARARYGADLMRAAFEIERIRPLPGRLVQLARDRFVASHEAGHAALATLMPGLQTPAGRALHEAYGDSVAILTAFDSDALTRAALDETNGDLTRSNAVSRIAEEFARTIAAGTRDPKDDADNALRDAAVGLRVSDIPGLDPAAVTSAANVPADSHANEPHYVSRIISGALYTHFAEQASAAARSGPHPEQAVREVRDHVADALHAALLFTPEDGGSLHDIGAALLRGARETEPPASAAAFETILRDRGLLDADSTPRITRNLPIASLADVATASNGTGPLAPYVRRWTAAEGVTEIERVTDGYGYTRVRYGTRDESSPKVAGSLVFDRNGVLVAASDGARA